VREGVAPWRKEKEGVDVDAPHGGGPSGAGSAMPCEHGSPGELTGGPRPHCRVAASANRRA
jgi:hypothetical protein